MYMMMMKVRYCYVIAFAAVILSLNACGQGDSTALKPQKSKLVPAKLSRTLSLDFMRACETGPGECEPVLFTRHNMEDSIKLIFPSGGTQSDVYLYTTDKDGNGLYGNRLRHDKKFHGQGLPVIDLSGLPDGKYVAHMMSCGVGGEVSVILKTEPK